MECWLPPFPSQNIYLQWEIVQTHTWKMAKMADKATILYDNKNSKKTNTSTFYGGCGEYCKVRISLANKRFFCNNNYFIKVMNNSEMKFLFKNFFKHNSDHRFLESASSLLILTRKYLKEWKRNLEKRILNKM